MSENKDLKNETEELHTGEKTKEELDIEKLEKRINQLKIRKQKKEQKLKADNKKARTKRLIQVGAMVEKMINLKGEDAIRPEMESLLAFQKALKEFHINNADHLRNVLRANRQKQEHQQHPNNEQKRGDFL
ncbi:hypothetical protein P4679_33250 [Priestia megaterium]|uniref:hypothetical protein n=1 Tax=Priestia megaterium TaxID=1404 RepID=UPI002E1ACA9A|nr:hypothetical protein [Priestia megaterium]